MEELKELIHHFRSWNKVWEEYQNGTAYKNIKPSSIEQFLEELNKRYIVIKKENNE